MLLMGVAATSLLLTSCFKDEPLNAECDIERISLHVDNPEEVFFQLSDSARTVSYTDSVITIEVRNHTDLTALAPQFTITDGATIVPASGSVQDFSNGPVTYTVTSQDGNWSRRYTVAIVPRVMVVNDTICYDFEHFELEPKANKYYVWHNVLADGSLGNDWVNGNAGFQLSKGSAKPEEYPSVPCKEGYEGYCLQLTTCDTGSFGVMVNKRIAAGNFFLGEFDVSVALKDAMRSTRFGIPFTGHPVKMTGYYQYTPGTKYQDKNGKEVAGMTDKGSIYAVLYRNHDANGNPMVLFGDDVQTNANIVAIAKVQDVHPTNGWTPWDITFNYTKELDEQLLANKGYSLTIVFSSSFMGDVFEGAVGSQLMIDKVRLICSHEE